MVRQDAAVTFHYSLVSGILPRPCEWHEGGKREGFQPQRAQRGMEGDGRDVSIENQENRSADRKALGVRMGGDNLENFSRSAAPTGRRTGIGWDAGGYWGRGRPARGEMDGKMEGERDDFCRGTKRGLQTGGAECREWTCSRHQELARKRHANRARRRVAVERKIRMCPAGAGKTGKTMADVRMDVGRLFRIAREVSCTGECQ